jgi:hypothetical protein
MKILLILFSFIVMMGGLHAQNKVSFTYDAAGNRIERVIVLATKSAEVQVSDSVYTDVIAERNIKIYPNPTEGQLKVEIGNTEGIKSCTITIFGMNNNRQVLKKKADLPVTDIDISNQPFGIYVMLIDIDGEYTSWKIMKK